MLPARYHALRDRTVAQVDAIFAEPVKLSFLKSGAVDPGRDAVTIEAVLRVSAGRQTGVAGAMVESWKSTIDAQRGQLHIDRTKYPEIVLHKGDRVRALARPGEPWFEVLSVDDRGATRLVVEVGEA